jgi:hypothetical protein
VSVQLRRRTAAEVTTESSVTSRSFVVEMHAGARFIRERHTEFRNIGLDSQKSLSIGY